MLCGTAFCSTQEPHQVDGRLEFLSRDGEEALSLEGHEGVLYWHLNDQSKFPNIDLRRNFKIINDFCYVITTSYTSDRFNNRITLSSVTGMLTKFDFYGKKLWEVPLSFTEGELFPHPLEGEELYELSLHNSPTLQAIIVGIGGAYREGLNPRIEVISYDGETLNSLAWRDVDLCEFRRAYTLSPPEKYVLIEGGQRLPNYKRVIIIWDALTDKIILTVPLTFDEQLQRHTTPGEFTIMNVETKIKHVVSVRSGQN